MRFDNFTRATCILYIDLVETLNFPSLSRNAPLCITVLPFCKPFKKISEDYRPTRSPRRTKNGVLSFVSSVQGKMVVRPGQIRRIGWVIKILQAQVGHFLLCCKCPVNRGIVVQEQDPLGDFPTEFFLQNVLQLHEQR